MHVLHPLVVALSLSTAAAELRQDPAPAPPPVQAPELVPGEVPASATAEARALWSAIQAATGGATPQAKVESFEISFDANGRDAQGNSVSFSDGRIRFLAPGMVDSALDKNGRRRLRGPKGDWMVESNGTKLRLQGVELERDRGELDQIAHVARTFANLIDARHLRLRSLATLAAPPFAVPASMLERAKALKWIEVLSPDFAIAHADGKRSTREVRAWIGVDAASSLPKLAMIAEDDKGTIVHETALLIALDKYRALDGFQVPFDLRTYAPDLSHAPWTFAESEHLRLWLKSGSLRAPLTPKDFEP